MEQCYSGGFIDNFIDKYTTGSQRRVIITAANGSEPSWGNGFSNAWTSGVARIDDQRNLNLLADTNGDLKISMSEAYNYANIYDPSASPSLPNHEHPQYSAKNPVTAGTTRFLSICPGTISRTITVTKPAAAETWNAGSPRLITWTYTGLSSTEYVNIISLEGYSADRNIAQVPAKTGSYTWTVPTTGLVAGSDYWVNISSVGTPIVYKKSPYFAITTAGSLGAIKVTSTPVQGASITIDGVLKSLTTNATITGIPPGDHKVGVDKNRLLWSVVLGNRQVRFHVTSEFCPGKTDANDVPPYSTIFIDSTIPGAEVLIDGKDTVLVTPASTEIMWGPHDVSVISYGYEIPLTQSVFVPQHEIVNTEFTLDQGSNVAPLCRCRTGCNCKQRFCFRIDRFLHRFR